MRVAHRSEGRGDDGATRADDFFPSPTAVRSRGIRRGKDHAKLWEESEQRKKVREDAKDTQIQEMQSSIVAVAFELKRKTSLAILMQALKVAPEGETKEKFQAKLIDLALNL